MLSRKCFGALLIVAALLSGIQNASAFEAVAPARVLPVGSGAAGSSINVVANRRHALFTHGDHQFAAYYDAQGFVVLAHRRLGTEQWETRRTEARGNIADAHNSISLAVDGEGFLHVAWDHHGGALNYARSKQPLSLELGAKQPMTSVAENNVTYPEFYLLPSGDLLCLYRDGRSGKGELVLNRYVTAERRWSNVQKTLISGEGKRSPYWGASVDRRGGLHLAWIWRDSPDVASNHDIAYAFSSDGGVTWSDAGGQSRTPPFSQTNADYAARIATGHNLMNSPWVTADAQGRPYIASYWSSEPTDPPQFRVLRYDGKQWTAEQITNRRDAFRLAGSATRKPPISRGVFLVEGGSQTPAAHLIYRDDAMSARAVLLSTAALGSGQWTERELTKDGLGAWEPTIDPVQWTRLQQIHLLMQQVQQRDGDDRSQDSSTSPVATLIVSPRELRIASVSPREVATRDPVKPTENRSQVIDVMKRVADWQLANPPGRDPRGWEVAPFYIGLLALADTSNEERYRSAVLEQGRSNQWQPGARMYHADDHAVIQAYLELYRRSKDDAMIAPARDRMNEILAHPSNAPFYWNGPGSQERWDWCDALFMAPTSWLMMWQATADRRYLDFMNREWWATTEHLFDPRVGWFFRDQSFMDQREPNGRTVHWSRGNGWVVAGLARVLERLPADHPDHKRYEDLYRRMMTAALSAQQPDGMWRAGLLDPAAHPAREATGTAFMTFALAWGINHGLLPRAQTEAAVMRGWNALTASVQQDGKLLDCQPVGDAPLGFDPSHTEPFGVGAFLLAGSEIAKLMSR